jgi:hypothetical protein
MPLVSKRTGKAGVVDTVERLDGILSGEELKTGSAEVGGVRDNVDKLLFGGSVGLRGDWVDTGDISVCDDVGTRISIGDGLVSDEEELNEDESVGIVNMLSGVVGTKEEVVKLDDDSVEGVRTGTETVGEPTEFEGVWVVGSGLDVLLDCEITEAEEELVDGVPEGVRIDIGVDTEIDELNEVVTMRTGGEDVVLGIMGEIEVLDDGVTTRTGGDDVVLLPKLDVLNTETDEFVVGVTTRTGGGDVVDIIELEKLVDGVITRIGGDDVVGITELEEFVDGVTTRTGGEDVVLLPKLGVIDTDEDEFVNTETVGV